jgi:predicted PurR-regulated permease PerM
LAEVRSACARLLIRREGDKLLKSPLRHWPPTFRVAATLVCVLAVGTILYWAQAVIIPIALAALLTFLLAPVVSRLERWRVPRVAAVALVILLTMGFFAGAGWLVFEQLSSFARALPSYRQNIEEKVAGVQSVLRNGTWDRIQTTVDELQADLERRDGRSRPSDDEPVPVRVESDTNFFGTDRLAVVSQILATAGVVIVLSIFMLIKREDVLNRVVSLGGKDALAATTKALQEASRRISRYLLVQFLVNLTFGICVALGCWLIGVPYALLWGACAAVFRYVPFVGPWIAALLPITVSLIHFPSWLPVIFVIALFLVLELMNNNFLEPYLYGRSVGISEVAVILAAVCWAWLWGPIGLILATPITVCLVVLGKYVPALSIFDRLLGDRPTLKPHVWLYQRLLSGDEEAAEDIVEESTGRATPMETCDELLLPAVLLTRRELAAERIAPEDEELIVASIRELIDEHVVDQREAGEEQTDAELPIVMGVAWDDGERAALEMLARLLDRRCDLQVLTPERLIAEWVDEIREKRPACVIVSSLPPGQLTRARLVCKRVNTQLPEMRIILARWGKQTLAKRTLAAFRAAGAETIASTLAEAHDAVVPLVQFQVAAAKQSPSPIVAHSA